MKNRQRQKDILFSILIFGSAFAVNLLIQKLFTTQTLVPMIFVFGVFLISLKTHGYCYGITSAIVSVFAVDFAFTYPYYVFGFFVEESILSAVIMMVVAVSTSTLNIRIRDQEKLRSENEKERMRGNLLRAISHDLRTPLTSIYAFPTRYIADQLFSCSRAAGISRYGKRRGGNKEQCQIVNNAIPTEMFSFLAERRKLVRNQLGLEKRLVVGHIGRFNPQKNHPFLLAIFAALLKKEPNAVLLLVGGGEDMPKMQAKVRELGIADHVRFMGVRSDVADLMQAMDVFAFPSLYEGLPVTMVEVQASGLPCIISDKVPPECILTEGLVDVMPLSAGAEAWADAILEKRNTPRTDRSAEIAAHGFDITTEAVKLQEFYLNAYEQNC